MTRTFRILLICCLTMVPVAYSRDGSADRVTTELSASPLEVSTLRLRISYEGDRRPDRLSFRVFDHEDRVLTRSEVEPGRLAGLDLADLGISRAGLYRLELLDDQDRGGSVSFEVVSTTEGLQVVRDQTLTMRRLPPPMMAPPPRRAMRAAVPLKWQRLFFSTDRAMTASPDPNQRFGSERALGEAISHGVAMVSFPPGHTKGRIERPTWWKFEVHVDPKKHVALQTLDLSEASAFYAELNGELSRRGGALLITIHGFRVPFQDAILLGAQFAHDLDFPGAAYLFTWPSKGEVQAYLADEATNEWSRRHFTTILDTLLRLPAVQRVTIVAHSMGSRIAAGALLSLQQTGRISGTARVEELVLAAPDFDAPLFEQSWPDLRRAVARTTVYCSSRDAAILASRRFHQEARLGEGGESALVLDGLDTIDASVSHVDMFGHGFFANDQSILMDIGELLEGKPTTRRCCGRTGCCLQQAQKAGLSYWVYRN